MEKLNIKLLLCLIITILTSIPNAIADHLLYLDIDGHGDGDNGSIQICKINPDTGGFYGCNIYPNPDNVTCYDTIAINPVTKKLYIADSLSGRYFTVCNTRDENGQMFNCRHNSPGSTIVYNDTIQNMEFNHSGKKLYFTKNKSNLVYGCDIDIHSESNPFPANCRAMNMPYPEREARHIAISNDDSWIFTSDFGYKKILACHIHGNRFDHCNDIKNDNFTRPSAIATDPINNHLIYIVNHSYDDNDKNFSDNSAISCAMSVHRNLMQFNHCFSYPTGYPSGHNIKIDPTGTYAYMQFTGHVTITISRLANGGIYYTQESYPPDAVQKFSNSMAFR